MLLPEELDTRLLKAWIVSCTHTHMIREQLYLHNGYCKPICKPAATLCSKL